ncbi:MAG: DeoR/GlpR transcriptional regulator [Anaerolineales bacterium]|nr:DeoR/GlpR transcriptional regulator [Anaerolineales bacterium]
MSSFDRRSEIVRYLRENERASTRTLSEHFQVSEVTIRHDLMTLEKQGWLARVHGGAEIAPNLQPEQPFEARQRLHLAEKANIAKAAAALVQPGDTIMLDSSTTAFQLALQLKALTPLRVVTNNLHVVATLSPIQGIEVVLIGGVVRSETASAVGPQAEEMLSHLHANKGFFGAAGLTAERGLTDADIREVQVKRAMVKAVDLVNVLLDASKFGQQSFLTFAPLAEVDHLFTDDKIPAEHVQICEDFGIKLTVI